MNRFIKRFFDIVHLFIFEIKAFIKSLYSLIKAKCFPKKYLGANLEIGCGTSVKKGFIGVDVHWQVDYPFDLRIGLPFNDNSIGFIYTEHTLEHLFFDEFQHILQECHRVLQKGGKLSIAVPRVDKLLKSYILDDAKFHSSISFSYPPSLKARLDIINYMLYMDKQHKNSFDEENLLSALKCAGFVEIKLRNFDPKLDLEVRKHDSLYCVCKK
jgi:predicted SAM-dependent methyltransferase